MTVIFTIIFGKIASIPTDGLPQMLFYQCGLLIWNYFNTTFSSNAGIFTANAAIYSKVYYPRIINPLANCISGLFGLVIQFVTFIGFFIYFKFFTDAGNTFSIGPNAILFIPLIFQILFLALGMGLWMSVLTAKYRDLAHLQGLITQALMYSSIIYPLSSVPDKFQWVAYINPISPAVEACRILLLGKGQLNPNQMVCSIGLTAIILITGMLLFQKTERTVVDTV
jgi:lipopolysaccharide transport system permease protein